MDPVTGKVVSAGIGAAAQVMTAPPSASSGWSDAWGMFDNSGWTVATGAGSAQGAKMGDKGGGGQSGAAGSLGDMLPLLVVAVVILGVVKSWR